MTARGSFISFSLALLAASIFADKSAANTESQGNPTRASAIVQSPASKQGLNFAVGERGLTSLSFNGQSLLVSPASGELQPEKSVFRAVLDAILPRSASKSRRPKRRPTQST